MARRRRGQRYVPKAIEPQKTANLTAADGFINSLAYLGEASELNKANGYKRHSISRDYEKLTTLYRENWIAKRIIDTPCEDMTRAWYTVSSAVEQDMLDELAKLEEKHDIKREITNGIRWARLYGGAAALIVIKGQEDMLDQPLNYDDLMPGCFRGLMVVDRTDGLYPSIDLEEDMDDPEFGYPKYYTVNLDKMGDQIVRVHHSRLIPFHGRMLPIQEEKEEDYWGASELEHVYEELQKRDATSANIAQLVFQANVAALKMADYGEVLGMGTAKQVEEVYKAIYAQNRIRNSFGMMIMGNEDSYEQHPYSFAGISDVYESFMLDMAGAAEIPATKLYGRAPQGMNSTGESDLKNYYEMLAQLQERQLKPALNKLLPIMAMSLWGAVPNDMEIVFEPLMTTTPAERAQIVQQSAGAIIQAFSAGIISQKIAMAELQETGKSIGAWTNITQEDIDNAEDTVDTGEGMEDPMGGMSGMGGAPGMGGEMQPAGQGQPPMMPGEEGQGQMPEAPQGAAEGQETPPEPETEKDDVSQMRAAVMAAARNGDFEKAKTIVRAHRVLNQKRAEEETQDGGPGSGPRPGYHKNGTSLVERARFMANPTADLPEPKRQSNGPTGTKAHVEKMNQERKDWSNLTTHQKIEGNRQMNRHIAQMRGQVMKLAAKGDIKGAKAIVKANRYLWANDPDSAQRVQSETLKMQKAVKPKQGLLQRIFGKKEVEDEDVWRSTEEGNHFKFDNETGEVKAGFGGKHNGKKLGTSWSKSGGSRLKASKVTSTGEGYQVPAPERNEVEPKTQKVPMSFKKRSSSAIRGNKKKVAELEKFYSQKYNDAKKNAEKAFNDVNADPETLEDALHDLAREAMDSDAAQEAEKNKNGTNKFGIYVPKDWEYRLEPNESKVLEAIASEFDDLQYTEQADWLNRNEEADRTMMALQAKLLGAEINPELSPEILKKYAGVEERVEVPGQRSMFWGENVENASNDQTEQEP